MKNRSFLISSELDSTSRFRVLNIDVFKCFHSIENILIDLILTLTELLEYNFIICQSSSHWVGQFCFPWFLFNADRYSVIISRRFYLCSYVCFVSTLIDNLSVDEAKFDYQTMNLCCSPFTNQCPGFAFIVFILWYYFFSHSAFQ